MILAPTLRESLLQATRSEQKTHKLFHSQSQFTTNDNAFNRVKHP